MKTRKSVFHLLSLLLLASVLVACGGKKTGEAPASNDPLVKAAQEERPEDRVHELSLRQIEKEYQSREHEARDHGIAQVGEESSHLGPLKCPCFVGINLHQASSE